MWLSPTTVLSVSGALLVITYHKPLTVQTPGDQGLIANKGVFDRGSQRKRADSEICIKRSSCNCNQAPRWSSHTPCYLYASSSSAQLCHAEKRHCWVPEAALHFIWCWYGGPLSQGDALAILTSVCNIAAEYACQRAQSDVNLAQLLNAPLLVGDPLQ